MALLASVAFEYVSSNEFALTKVRFIALHAAWVSLPPGENEPSINLLKASTRLSGFRFAGPSEFLLIKMIQPTG
jgi:hypothetical protein